MLANPRSINANFRDAHLPAFLSRNIKQSIFEYLSANFWMHIVGRLSKADRSLIEILMNNSANCQLRVRVPSDCVFVPRLIHHLLTFS